MKLLLIVVLMLAVNLYANETDRAALDSAFQAGDYERVELLALRLLQDRASLTPDEQIGIHLTTGYALIMLDREPAAREHFADALELNPELKLDPVEVSPKFRAVFDDVKQDREASKEPDVISKTLESAALGLLRPSRTSHALNLLLPGAGQLNEERYVRGAVWIGLQGAATAFLVVKLSDQKDSRDAYLAATDPADIAAKYDDYDRDYRAVWLAGFAAGAVYVASQVDLAFMRRPELRLGSLRTADAGVEMCWRW